MQEKMRYVSNLYSCVSLLILFKDPAKRESVIYHRFDHLGLYLQQLHSYGDVLSAMLDTLKVNIQPCIHALYTCALELPGVCGSH